MDKGWIQHIIVKLEGGGMGMCGELQALSVLSALKETPYLMNRKLSGPQHRVR